MNWRRPLRAVTGLLAVGAATAQAAPQCSVSTNAQLDFGTVVALESTGDRSTDSASSFWINCNAEVTTAPRLYSSGARVMQSAPNNLPFRLSLGSAADADLPAASPGAPVIFPRDGTNRTVTVYGKIRASDFKALPPGRYSATVGFTIEYQ